MLCAVYFCQTLCIEYHGILSVNDIDATWCLGVLAVMPLPFRVSLSCSFLVSFFRLLLFVCCSRFVFSGWFWNPQSISGQQHTSL